MRNGYSLSAIAFGGLQVLRKQTIQYYLSNGQGRAEDTGAKNMVKGFATLSWPYRISGRLLKSKNRYSC